MGYGYLILLLAVSFIAYTLFEKRMIQRANDLARKHGRKKVSYKLTNRALIIGALIIWAILACVAIVTSGAFWVILASVATIVCLGYILWWAYHARDCALISAMTYLSLPFGTFVFCIIANAVKFPGGLIAGAIAVLFICLLPKAAFLQGFYDRNNDEDE